MANKKVTLKDGNDILYPQSVLNGVDTTNKIASNIAVNNGNSYTATEDCWVRLNVAYGTGYINDLEFYWTSARYLLPIKKGQVYKTSSTNTNITCDVYGILK